MNKKITTTIITVLMAASFCSALKAQGKSNDLSVRFSLGIAPGIDDADGFLGFDGVDDDGGARLEILAVKRFWDVNNPVIGWSIGGGLFFGSHALSEPGFEVDITTFGTMIQGGLVIDAGRGLTFELGPYLGAGTADNETSGFSDGEGPYFLYGIKGSAFFLLSETIEVGVDLGYEGFTHEQEYEFGFGTEDVTFSGSGAHVALTVGVAF